MRTFERRVCKLEAEIQARQPAWSADIEAVRARVVARIKVHIGEALAAGWHPTVKSAREILGGDTPAQAAADRDILERWGRAHPELLHPDEDGRTRIMQKLEEMAQRRHAHKGVI
jgi:hypothetical protein